MSNSMKYDDANQGMLLSDPIIYIDGKKCVDFKEASVSIFDDTFMRGDGCFEACRVYFTGGKVFRWKEHEERLHRSATTLNMKLPPAELSKWIETAAADHPSHCIIRVFCTRGSSANQYSNAHADPKCFIMVQNNFNYSIQQFDASRLQTHNFVTLRLNTIEMSWYGGVKWTSYAPNMCASREAKINGYDEAIITRNNVLLEGPTFCIAWVYRRDDKVIFETPNLDLGILRSVSRGAIIEAAANCGYEISYMDNAKVSDLPPSAEIACFSTTRDLMSVSCINERKFETGGRLMNELREAYLKLIFQETCL